MMDFINKIENKLVEVNKSLPSLPKEAKDWLAKYWPFFALVGGALEVIAAIFLYRVLNVVHSDFYNLVRDTAKAYGTDVGYSSFDKFMVYFGVTFLLVNGVLLVLAYTKLAKKQAQGWNLMFLASLVSIVYSVLNLGIPERGFGGFIGSLVGTAIGIYLLFQMRDVYKTDKKVAHEPKKETKETADKKEAK